MNPYNNVMETLVEEEVDRVFSTLPDRLTAWLNPGDMITFALNRLPPLYACSQEGIDYQLRKARNQHGDQINQVIHQALAAVQGDPLRRRTPLLKSGKKSTQVYRAEQSLKQQSLQPFENRDPWAASIAPSCQENPTGTKREMTWQEYKRLRKANEEMEKLRHRKSHQNHNRQTSNLRHHRTFPRDSEFRPWHPL